MITPPEHSSITILYESSQGTPAGNASAESIWKGCIEIVRSRLNKQSFKAWFEPITPLTITNDKLRIQVPSQFFCDWLEEHYFSLISEALTQAAKREIVVEYVVAAEDREVPRPVESAAEPAKEELPHRPKPQIPAPTHPLINSALNKRYTFDNYIKGESNQFARAAALAVANNPGGTSFNPLLIYGGVGLGKTHLVHAIGNHVLHSGKSQRVLYVSSEKFTVDFVDAIQKDRVNEFSAYYRSADVLIVDDVQFLGGKEKTQDVFFHTFNELHQGGKQIILSSDRPPKELRGLNERLVSRFQWGLVAEIQIPDLETRIAILRKKSSDDGCDLSHEVLEFIAASVTSNIRELEGCLISLLARASLENREIDLELAREVVRSIIGEVRSRVTIDEIQRLVCTHLDIPEDLIRAKTRKQEVVNARQIAMYLAKELTNSSLKTIGLHFGGRDHSTVIHAYQTVEDAMTCDSKQKSVVHDLRSRLERHLGG